ncbi:MAG: RidA family protein [Pseudorhodoplanes sp.]|nr:RidA family protein [Pseudorhodoplanes sp.]
MWRSFRVHRRASCSASSCARWRARIPSAKWHREETRVSENTIRKFPGTPGGLTVLNPAGWPQPKGYANGIKARGEMVFVGGMVGWDERGVFPHGLVAQIRQALGNIAAVLAEGGARPDQIVRMTWYVVDMEEYRSALPEIGAVYREVMGRHFPAMALVEVKSLVEREARVEIEATAMIPD